MATQAAARLTKKAANKAYNRHSSYSYINTLTTTPMLSSTDITLSLRSNEDIAIAAARDIEQQILLVDKEILPLRKAQKELAKVEEEITNTNFLIDSGIGSKADQKALASTKKQLCQRRIKLWGKLEALPALKEERRDLVIQLDVLQRQHGLLL